MSNRIKALREERGWSIQDLAHRSQIWVTQLYRYEAGQTPTIRVARKIANAFGSTVDEMFPPEPLPEPEAVLA